MNKQPDLKRAPLSAVRAGGLAVLSLAILCSPARAGFDEQFDDQEKPWQEITVLLPAAPVQENLLPFYVSPTATHTYSVDGKSISVGEDGVVRYTLVAQSAGGAQNISYEGIRCQTREMKSYAFGHKDGKWSRSRRDQWQRIVGTGANRPQAALQHDYFCRGGLVSGKAEDIAKRLREQQAYSDHAE